MAERAAGTVSPGKQTLTGTVQRRASGAGSPGRDAGDKLASAASEPGMPLDAGLRDRAEGSLGMDLGAVRVHTGPGAAEAAGAISAQAYTVGSDVYFGQGHYQPGTDAGDRLIAHEVVHVAQQAGAPATGPLPQLEVSRTGEPAEAEADRGAEAILIGAPFSPSEQPAPIARAETLTGNPAELQDSAGNPTTTHREPTVDDAANRPGTREAPVDERAANVKPVATEAAPLHLEPPVCPSPELVYEESSEQVSPPPSGFTTVARFRGNIDRPNVHREALPGLFLDGGPTANDVQQSGIGDCYFLALLMSVVARDPGKITSMMADDGANGATVTFWRQETAADGTASFHQQQVHASSTLAFDLNADGSTGGIHGAQLRSGELPKAQDYWSNIDGDALEVHRKDIWQLARWAPLMEKAFARYAQEYGQYGGTGNGEAQASDSPSGSGYAVIDGGWSHYTMFVFYGPDALEGGAANVQQQAITWAPGSQILAQNPAVVDQLLLLAGRGEQAAPEHADAPILTATSMNDQLIPRLKDAIDAAKDDADWNNLGTLRQGLIEDVRSAITLWEANDNEHTQRLIGDRCVVAARPGPQPESIAPVHAANPQRILFGIGSHTPSAEDKARLTAFGGALAATTDVQVNVDIFGHASSDGGDDANRTLAERRAAGVRDALAEGNDVSTHNINQQVAGELGAAATPEWRRADIVIGDPELHDENRSPAIRAMMDLILDLRNIGTDNSTGQRNIYGNHVYSLVAAAFLGVDGAGVPLADAAPGPAREALFPQVDMTQSTVRLRNPHHGNEPDRQGDNRPTRPEDGPPSSWFGSDGLFTMSMDEFFRNFTSVESGVLPRS
jgi:outer membrane protein OmpA-like peptidoglycan-associated protein